MLLNTLKYIYHHPLNKGEQFGAILRFLKWQLQTKLNPYPVVYPFTAHTHLIMQKGLTGATGNLYCGLMEFEDMAFVLHFLRKEDHFVDVGANVGVYTILAAGEVGAHTTCVEPVPSTFNILQKNIALNLLQEKVNALNIGLGSTNSIIKFTQSFDTVNHVATATETNTIDVPVACLDDVLQNVPALIKIDVEGFETEVLNGAASTLANPQLKGIIIELNESGLRYGYDESLIHQKLLNHGFRPYQYQPFERKLNELSTFGSHNTIYLRDLEFVQNRIATAVAVKIRKQQF
ncbi:MAG: hypothetical protein RLY16_2532 [Bacteroidota bacterium]|jgi:FkbM family methyltransferase